jgi:hypothetical protein
MYAGGPDFFYPKFLFAVNPHVINQVFLWEYVIVNTLLTSPCATDGQIDDQVMRLVEWPGIISGTFIFVSKV